MRNTKEIFLDDQVTSRIMSGTEKVYDIMKQVYGPTSGNVMIEKNYGDPVLTHDGVSVMREITFEDPVENMVAKNLYQASKSTNDKAGDGTTATVLLGSHIIKKAMKRIASGYSPLKLRKGILEASADIVGQIRSLSEDVKSLNEVSSIACGDEEMGKLIADTVDSVGDNGNVTVEESRETVGIEREIVEGFYFKRGYINPYMVTNPDRMIAELRNAYVLVTEKKLSKMTDIGPILIKINNGGLMPLPGEKGGSTPGEHLLIVGDITGDALNVLIGNKLNGAVISVAVTNPMLGDQAGLSLEDIAIYTGAKVITESDSMDKIDLSYLGKCGSVKIDSESTTIIGGKGDEADIKKRIKGLRESIKEEKNVYRKERFEDRLARLSGKVGVIKVGGSTETGMGELKDRVDDAVCATKAAKEEGIVPGGAVTLANISFFSPEFRGDESEDEIEGYRLTLESLGEPFKDLIDNSFGSSDFYFKNLEGKEFGMGYNIKKDDKLIDAKKNGVIDATKVIRNVVENACSAAVNIITTSVAIAIKEKKDDANN